MKTSYLLLIYIFALSCSSKSSNNALTPLDTTPNNSPNVCKPSLQEVEKLQIFPIDHPLNQDISNEPIDQNSALILENIGLNTPLKADLGSGLYNNAPIGIPFDVICSNQPKVSITYRKNSRDDNYGDESDSGPMPIPSDARIEGNGKGDSHVLIVDKDNKMLYELYNASKANNGWEASSGAIFDLNKTIFRPAGWTSGDAAGLPIFPTLIRYDEVVSEVIDHAIRFTIEGSKVYNGYVHPARHRISGGGTGARLAPMGMRLRLKANVNLSGYSKTNQVILTAMKKYGLILADAGSDMYISGTPDERWNNDDLRQLANMKASDFEVVKMGKIER